MPYTKPGRRKEVIADRKRATEEGDWNLLYTNEYLEAFIAKPSYATIHRIGKAATKPKYLPGVEALDEFLSTFGFVSEDDRTEAREEALAEFRRRVVALYEKQCIVANGDLDKYIQAERVIQEKFATVEAK